MTHSALRAVSLFALAVSTVACKSDTSKTGAVVPPTNFVPWSAPVGVRGGASSGAAPSFALSPGGKLALGWITAPNGGSDGRLVVDADAREIFSKAGAPADSQHASTGDSASGAANTLTDPLAAFRIHGEAPPTLAYGSDSVLYAAYLVTKAVRNNKPQNALRFASSGDGGRTWTAPVSVTPDSVFGVYDTQALLATTTGNIYVAWIAEGSADTAHVYLAKSASPGVTWSKRVLVDADPSAPCGKISMAVGADGALYMAWRKRFAGEVRDIVVSRSNDEGATWSEPTRVYADEWQVNYCVDAGPSLAVAKNGTVHVAWYTGKLGRAGTQYAQSTDGAKTFARPVELGLAANSNPSHVQLMLNSEGNEKTIVAVWDDGTMKVPEIVMRVSYDGGKTFTPSQAVSTPGAQAMYPTAVLRGDTVRVAWQERSAAGVTTDSLERKRKRDKDDPTMNIEVVGALQIMARQGVLNAVRK